MKIIVIHGQNHKGNTWNVANILLQDITCEKEVKEFFLPKDLNHFCTGCYSCLEGRDKCPFWEDKKPIDDAMLVADNLLNWGIPEVITYGISVNAMNWNMVPDKKKVKIEKDMKTLASKLSRKKTVKVGIKTRFLFLFYGGMQKADWGASPSEKEYWKSRGWLNGVKPWS